MGERRKRSLEEALRAVEEELGQIEAEDASLWSVVQLGHDLIREKRANRVSWAQIAAGFQRAGFPGASETNVRLAYQAAKNQQALKKVTKARNNIKKKAASKTNPDQNEATAPPSPSGNMLGNSPRMLKNRFED